MMRFSLLLLACLTLALMSAGEADAKEPEWSYSTDDHLYSVAISADGEYIAAGTGGNDDYKVYLFDKDSSTPLWSYTTEDTITSVSISADGEYIAAGSWDGKVYFFNKDSSTPLWSYTTEDTITSVSISADGEYIAAGSQDNNVYLFDKDSSTPLWNYTTEYYVHSIGISADGEYIAAGAGFHVYLFGKDSSTPLWSYETGGWVVSVAISADGEYIVAGVNNHNVHLFGKDNSTPLWSYTTIYDVYSVAISADGEYIVAGFGGDRVYLFDKNSSTPLWSYTAGDTVRSVAISADGEYIAASSYNPGEVYLFDNNLPPTATIDSITPSSARFDAEVTFSGTGWSDSDGTVVAYEWNSDIDGFLSDDEDFSITGFSVGNRTISFRVQDNDGTWSSWSTAELYIYPNAPPVGTIDSIEPSPAKKGDEVTFNGTGTDDNGTVVAYLWESSIDGELSTEANFSSSDLSLGHHAITFRVQDNDGDWNNAASESLWIYAVPVAIAGDDVSTTPTLPVQFNGQGTDEDGTIAKYEWDFDGNGVYDWSSTENGRELNIYNNKGTYTAMLRVTDNDGFTDTDTVVITVTEKKIQIDEEGIPTLSVITTMAAVAVMALRRRPE